MTRTPPPSTPAVRRPLGAAGRLVAALVVALGATLGAAVGLVGPATADDAPPTDGPGPDTLTWSLVPADADGKPDGRQSFRASLDPGASITEQAVLTNYSSHPITFTLTASDGLVAADGSFDILQDDEQPTDSGAWVTVQDSVTVDPESAVLVPFRVVVPDDAVPGDHPAGLTAGVATTTATQDGPAVGFSARVGIRLHLRVTGELVAALDVPQLSTHYRYSWNPFAAGHLDVTPTVANDGNVRVQSAGTITTAGLFGVARGTTSVAPREVLPRSSYATTTQTDVWPLVRVRTTVTVTPSAVGTDDLGGATLAAATLTTTTWVVPWPQLALVALVVLLGWFTARTRRRRHAALEAALARARAEGAAVHQNLDKPVQPESTHT